MARSLFYRPELDGLRAIAVILVIGSHAHVPGFGLGAPAGVTLFFVLSGYLITSLLVAELDRTGRVSLAAFYLRRGLRLLPALFAYLIVVLIAYRAGLFGDRVADPGAIVAVLTYVGNWAAVGGMNLGMFGHTWSLAVEEQFYLVAPLALVLALRYTDRRVVGVALLGVAALIWPWREMLMAVSGYQRVFGGTDSMADALLIGSAIALLRLRLPSWAGWLGIVGLVAVAEVWTGEGIGHWYSIAALVSGVAVAGAPQLLGRLAYIGRISYGLYLWHYLFVWYLPWPVAIAASLIAASVSYRYLEQPFLRLKDRRSSRRPALVPAAA